MDLSQIETALISALSLLKNEVDNIDLDDLREDYISVIEKLEMALKEIDQDE